MKFSYAIDAQRRMIFQRYEGACSLALMIACTRRLLADPAYSKLFDGYIDLTKARPEVTLEDLHAFIAFLRGQSQLGEGRYAAVTTSPVITAMGVLYQRTMARHHAFAVFSSHEAAAEYLSLQSPVPPLEEQTVEIDPAAPRP